MGEATVDSERSLVKEKTGRVVSDKMDKTVVVEVEYVKRHPLYHRALRRHRRFKAHDENNQAKTGDLVRLVETRPLSKEKRWRLVEIIEKAQ
jgi:small subunit ribosomal protein S17